MSTVISIENVSKQYRLGEVGTGTLSHDLNRWWYKVRGKEDPYLMVGESNDRSKKGESEYSWALKDVSFEVKQGEVLGIIGRNGAGKSTLLKILSRVTTPTTGAIKVRGRIASLLEVGTGFHPELSGRENIFLNGAILGMRKAEIAAKFDEIVEFSGCERYIDTPVKRYSSGMYVRLAFAVAAHLEPEILIVDEVLAVGDAEFQKKCLGKMKDVAGQGRTVLFVSHNMQAIATLTNKALFMAQGQKQFLGGTSEAVGHYMAHGQIDSFEYIDKSLSTRPSITLVRIATSLEGNVHIHSDPVELKVQVHIPVKIQGACISVQIFDTNLINHIIVWTHQIDHTMCNEPGTYELTCLIPKLRLYMGRYRLRVRFTEPPGGESFQTLDGICPFEVVMQNNHRLFQWWPNECAYLEDCQWSVQTKKNLSTL